MVKLTPVHGPWRSAPDLERLDDLGIIGTREQVVATMVLQAAVRGRLERQRSSEELLLVRDLDTGTKISLSEANTVVKERAVPPRHWWRVESKRRLDGFTAEDLAVLAEAEAEAEVEAERSLEEERRCAEEESSRAAKCEVERRMADRAWRRETGLERRVDMFLVKQQEEQAKAEARAAMEAQAQQMDDAIALAEASASKAAIVDQLKMATKAMQAALEAAAAAEKGANAAHEVALAAVHTTRAIAATNGHITEEEEEATLAKVAMAVAVAGLEQPSSWALNPRPPRLRALHPQRQYLAFGSVGRWMRLWKPPRSPMRCERTSNAGRRPQTRPGAWPMARSRTARHSAVSSYLYGYWVYTSDLPLVN